MQRFKSILTVLFFTFIPSLAMYLSMDNGPLDLWQVAGYIGPKVKLSLIKPVLRVISIGLTAFYLSITRELLKNKLDVVESQRNALIYDLKSNFLEVLQSKLPSTSITTVDIRIFVEKKNILSFLIPPAQKVISYFSKYKFKKKFVIKNIEGLARAGNTNKLEFEVSPSIEGLVGQCYNEKKIVYDEELLVTNKTYNLNPFQKSKTHGINFCLCVPIFGSNNEIIAIVSFDSYQNIIISNGDRTVWETLIINFCQTLHETLPEIFK